MMLLPNWHLNGEPRFGPAHWSWDSRPKLQYWKDMLGVETDQV